MSTRLLPYEITDPLWLHGRSVTNCIDDTTVPMDVFGVSTELKLHSHQTPDQPPLIPDQFLWLGRVWSGKKLPALIEERIYPR